jgi:hypothetical protein
MNNYKWVILERRRISIFPVIILMHAYTSQLRSIVGRSHKHFIMDYKEGHLFSYKDGENWDKTAKDIFNFILE